MNVDLADPVNVDLVLSTANSFLHLLATETGGRYHRCPDDFNADMFAHKLLSEGFGDSEVKQHSLPVHTVAGGILSMKATGEI